MFITDQPIETHKEDVLERHAFAKALAGAILGYNQSGSISVGLYGEWGSGKTSIINMALEEIESISSQKKKHSMPFIIKFNPWNFSDQNQLIHQFFNELSSVLNRNNLEEKQSKLGRAIQTYARFFEPLSYMPTVSFIGEAAKAVKNIGIATEKAGEANAKDINAVKSELNSLLKELDTKLIIVIDDIDRLNNTEIRQIFQLIKSLADFPNTTYLLSFDKNVVINALKKVQEGSGNKYLEKVVQVPFEIPQMSKREVERLLFSKLDELIHDLPEERWNQIYWGNIYHSGLKHFYNNIRDVNRYLNSLSFGFSLVKDEVNPIDFIAITAIQVFIPNLYESIKTNKDLFVGKSISHQQTEDLREKERSSIETIVGEVEEIQSDILQDFLKRLFPKLENIVYSHSSFEDWRKEGRLCSPDIFDTYFKLFIPKDEIPLKEIKRILSTGSNMRSFSRELIKLNKDGKIIRFLERMEDYTSDGIPEKNIATIITALMNIGDKFPEGDNSFFATSTSMRILRLLYQLSHRFKEQEKRFEIFNKAIENTTNSLHTIVNEIGVQCQQHGKYGFKERPEAPEKMTVNQAQLEKLVALALRKVEDWAKTDKLAKHKHLLSILYMWRCWDSPKRVNKYVNSIIKKDNDLIVFITHFLSKVKSHTLNDYVDRIKWQINLDNVAETVKLEDVEKRIRKIQSSKKYKKLKDKEKLAIKTFLDTYDGKIENRF